MAHKVGGSRAKLEGLGPALLNLRLSRLWILRLESPKGVEAGHRNARPDQRISGGGAGAG